VDGFHFLFPKHNVVGTAQQILRIINFLLEMWIWEIHTFHSNFQNQTVLRVFVSSNYFYRFEVFRIWNLPTAVAEHFDQKKM